jgi:hypothetical protein
VTCGLTLLHRARSARKKHGLCEQATNSKYNPSHDNYVLKSSNISQGKIMVSQKTWEIKIWTSEISKDANSRPPLALGGNYRMASYTS